MKRPLVLGLAFGAISLAACQIIAGIERVEKVDGVESTSSSGASGSGSSGVVKNDPCGHVLPPDVPEKSDPGDDLPAFVLAASTLSLTKPASNGIGGFDLDLSCTCDNRSGTNQDGGSSCKPRGTTPVKCDQDGGIDNEARGLFAVLSPQVDLDESFRKDSTAGKRTIMLYLKGWNGQPNDLEVGAGIFVSNGATEQPLTETIESGKTDWTYPSVLRLQNGVIQPAFPVPGGYVKDGRLVVKNAGTVTLLLGSNGLTFNEALLVGDLKRDAATGVVRFIGVVGGRIRDTELLSAAGQLKISGTDPACEFQGGVLYTGIIKPSVCGAVDLAQGQRSDFKDSPCDSISSAIAMEAFSATISGDLPNDIPPETNPNPCAPANQPADFYKCN